MTEQEKREQDLNFQTSNCPFAVKGIVGLYGCTYPPDIGTCRYATREQVNEERFCKIRLQDDKDKMPSLEGKVQTD